MHVSFEAVSAQLKEYLLILVFSSISYISYIMKSYEKLYEFGYILYMIRL